MPVSMSNGSSRSASSWLARPLPWPRVVYISQQGSVSTDIDGGTEVLYAVAAAVVGGTALFGGRGRMVNALLGGF